MKSYHYIAIGIAVLVILWFASGLFVNRDAEEETHETVQHAIVRVKRFVSEDKDERVKMYGVTEPNKTVMINAEVSGRIVEETVEMGSYLKAGDVIYKIDLQNRKEALDAARASLKQAEIEFEAAKKLKRQGFRAETSFAAAESKVELARSALKKAEIDFENIEIKAPFDGILENQKVKVGAFVNIGFPIAEFVSIDPLDVIGHVSEFERSKIKLGQKATITLVTGEVLEGYVKTIDTVSNASTHTFKVEICVQNDDMKIPAGLTLHASIKTGNVKATLLPTSLLVLNDKGDVGVSIVEDNKAKFKIVTIIDDTATGMWVTGLSDTADIITLGGAFVSDGQVVIPVFE